MGISFWSMEIPLRRPSQTERLETPTFWGQFQLNKDLGSVLASHPHPTWLCTQE